MGWKKTAKKAGRAVGKRTLKAAGWAVQSADEAKQWAEPRGLDKYIFMAAANTGLVYGAAELIDRTSYSDATNGLIMLGTGAALLAGNQIMLGPRFRRARNYVAGLNRDLDKSRFASWVKSLGLASTTWFFCSGLNPYFQQARQDFFQRTRDSPLITDARPAVPEAKEGRPGIYSEFGYSPIVTHDFSGTELAGKDSMTGRIQRTLRWQPIYRAIETAHGMPKDTLAGMIMQESYGNPVQPNASNDGGLGLTHIQGTVAEQWGLYIYGNSTRDSDRNHGGQIREMLRNCNYDAACAQQYDDRAHMIKVLDTAARIVRKGKDIHGSWDLGVEYYRGPAMWGRIADGGTCMMSRNGGKESKIETGFTRPPKTSAEEMAGEARPLMNIFLTGTKQALTGDFQSMLQGANWQGDRSAILRIRGR